MASISARGDAGVDLAIVVDRSHSMSRHPRLVPAVLRMSLDVLSRNGAMYGLDHRVTLISFASSATVDLPWTTMRRGIRLQFAEHACGGSTDITAALRTAVQRFAAVRQDAARRRAILLLTDGAPYVRGSNMSSYVAELRRFVRTHITDARISIDIVLLGEPADRDRSLWRSITSGVHPAEASYADVLATAHAVITRLAGTPSAESTPAKHNARIEHIVVPPYLEMIVFDVFRSSAGAEVNVYPPESDRPVRKGVNGVEMVRLGAVLETLVVPRPIPGEWVVKRSRADAEVRVRSQHFFPRGVLLQPDARAIATTRDRIRIAYQVLDDREQPLEELRDYPLSLKVTVATPDGRKFSLPMTRAEKLGAAVFRTTHDAQCRAPGRYWTDVHVMATDAAGRRLEVFRDRWSGFTVPAGAPLRAQAATLATEPSAASRSASPLWLLPIVAVAAFIVRAIALLRKT